MTEAPGADPNATAAAEAAAAADQASSTQVDKETQGRLDTLEKDARKRETTLGKQERLISTMQRQAATLERQLATARTQAAGPTRGPAAARAAAAALIDNTDQNEAIALRALIEKGLTEEDLPASLDLASATPAEVKLTIELVSVNSKLQQLGASIESDPASDEAARLEAERQIEGDQVAEEEGAGPAVAEGAAGLIDAGGPTGTEADKRSAKVDRVHEASEKLLESGNRRQGAYLKLRAIHNDPRRIVSGGDDIDDLDSIDL